MFLAEVLVEVGLEEEGHTSPLSLSFNLLVPKIVFVKEDLQQEREDSLMRSLLM